MGEEFRCEKRRVSSDTEKQLSVGQFRVSSTRKPLPYAALRAS